MIILKKTFKKYLYLITPLLIRKYLAIWINRQRWINADSRGWWATQLICDYAKKDLNAYHKFLWRYHLSYAESYESNLRFGYNNINITRKIFFSELQQHLKNKNISAANDIKSVFEVGCSLGYLLHYLETDVFTDATVLSGNDIDRHSITEGKKFLQQKNSKVDLIHADMEYLESVLDNTKYDIVFGAGILLYFNQETAQNLVTTMLRHTNTMLSFTGLAHPDIDNANLNASVPRSRDSTWIHNIDEMIKNAGGKIIARRWEGDKITDGNTIYFVFAEPL